MDVLDLVEEGVDVVEEVPWVVVDDNVLVDPLPPQDVRGRGELLPVQEPDDDLEGEGARVDHLKVTARHLQSTIDRHDLSWCARTYTLFNSRG